MTRISTLLLLPALAGLAACDQSGVGGAAGDANTAAQGGMEASAEAEADPANTLENQAAALNSAGETAQSSAADEETGNAAGGNMQAASEGNAQ